MSTENLYERKIKRMEERYEVWYDGEPTNPLVVVTGYKIMDIMLDVDGLIDAWATCAVTYDLEKLSFKKVVN